MTGIDAIPGVPVVFDVGVMVWVKRDTGEANAVGVPVLTIVGDGF